MMYGQCKWSVIGAWVSDKRLPATEIVIRTTDDRETGQVDRTSLFLIETEIEGSVDNSPWHSPLTISVISAPRPQTRGVGARVECHSVTRGQRKCIQMWHHFTHTQLQLRPWCNWSSSQYLLGILGYDIVMRSASLSHTLIHWAAPFYSCHSAALQPTFPRPCQPGLLPTAADPA